MDRMGKEEEEEVEDLCVTITIEIDMLGGGGGDTTSFRDHSEGVAATSTSCDSGIGVAINSPIDDRGGVDAGGSSTSSLTSDFEVLTCASLISILEVVTGEGSRDCSATKKLDGRQQ